MRDEMSALSCQMHRENQVTCVVAATARASLPSNSSKKGRALIHLASSVILALQMCSN